MKIRPVGADLFRVDRYDEANSRIYAKIRTRLTLTLLTCRIWWAPNNASKWQVGFNSAFKGL